MRSRLLRSAYWPLDLDLGRLPPVEATIGYGSGVFRQLGYSGPRPMVDVVLVARGDRVKQWHQENLAANPGHYSGSMRSLGPGAIACVQDWGPGLYYNPHVRLATLDGGALEAKYGVVSAEALQRDLRQWDSLYMAGRLHKPCLVEFHGQDAELREKMAAALAANHRAALSAALLLCGPAARSEPTTLLAVLSALVRLSYDGDIRSGIAEDPNKVSNIVRAQAGDIWRIYAPIAAELGVLVRPGPEPGLLPEDGVQAELSFDGSSAGRRRLFEELPAALRERLGSGTAPCPWDDDEALRGLLRDTVWGSSLLMAAKGLLTAGASRGLRYTLAKVRKRFK